MEKETILKALDVIEDGVLIIDRDFVIVYANKSAKKLLRQDKVLGKHSYEAIWGRDGITGKTPAFISFDTHKVASAERAFEDGTCLSIQAYPFDENHIALTIWDVTNYVTLERRLESAGTDSVTGLRSSTVFNEDLEKELDRSKRAKSNMVLVMIDVGSVEGDSEVDNEKALKEIAAILTETARSYDLVYRFKGNIFGILMPHCPIEGARNTSERILEKLSKISGGATPSLGISTSEKAFTGRDVLRLAERALYVANHRGGNTIVVG